MIFFAAADFLFMRNPLLATFARSDLGSLAALAGFGAFASFVGLVRAKRDFFGSSEDVSGFVVVSVIGHHQC